MVTFSRYVEIAYEVADEKGFGGDLRGPGSGPANNRFMSELADAYNRNDHAEASEQAARRFLQDAVQPP
jgi:hypothetical protein